MPVLTKICGGIGVGVVKPEGDVIGCDGEVCCALIDSVTLAAVVDDNLIASSMLCLTNGGMAFSEGSERRNAISAGSSGRIKIE